MQHKDLRNLSLQITQSCNFACLQCDFQRNIRSISNTRPVDMSRALFSSIIEQYQAYTQQSPKTVVLSAGAEPMMHPFFLDLCKEVDTAGIFFSFDTNASKLDKNIAKELLSLPKFKRITFSVDGFSATVFESIRRGGNFEEITGNILNFLEIASNYDRTDLWIEVNMVLQEKNKHEADKVIEYWIKQVSQVNISTLRQGTSYESPNWLPKDRTPCDFLDNYLRVLTDGSVVVCCIDDQFVSKIGDISKQSLEEIWNGEEYQKLREAHVAGDYGYLPICLDCQAWAGFYQARNFHSVSDEITIGYRPVNIVAFKIKEK